MTLMPKTVSPPEVERETGEQLTPLYHVVLLDDDDHTYDYVVEMLQNLFLMSAADAFMHAVEVDNHGPAWFEGLAVPRPMLGEVPHVRR